MTISVLALARRKGEKGTDTIYKIGDQIPYWDNHVDAYEYAYENKLPPTIVYECYSMEDAIYTFGPNLVHYLEIEHAGEFDTEDVRTGDLCEV